MLGEPETYRIEDEKKEPIEGIFYREELQPTKQPEGEFLVERVLKHRGSKMFVKWLGYPDSFNSWADSD